MTTMRALTGRWTGKIAIGTAAGLGALVGLGWAGLLVRPAPFPPYPERTAHLDRVALAPDLPAPVERYFHAVFGGEGVPVVTSAVLTGRAKIRLGRVTFPGRFRFTHQAGRGYRHYIEVTWLGVTLMKLDEWYLEGHARLALPTGVVEGKQTDSAANLGLWAESVWLPSILATDRRLRWEPVDANTARLVVPSAGGEDGFDVGFDHQTGLMAWMQAMRYRDEADRAKIPWRTEMLGWRTFEGVRLPSPSSATWLDQGSPWLVATIEAAVYNVDVARYIRAAGR